MTPERWLEVKELCQRALECEPPDRGAFLAEFCLDDQELRREVEALLTQATASDGILDAPIWEKLGIAMKHTAAAASGRLCVGCRHDWPLSRTAHGGRGRHGLRLRSGTAPPPPRRGPESQNVANRPDFECRPVRFESRSTGVNASRILIDTEEMNPASEGIGNPVELSRMAARD